MVFPWKIGGFIWFYCVCLSLEAWSSFFENAFLLMIIDSFFWESNLKTTTAKFPHYKVRLTLHFYEPLSTQLSACHLKMEANTSLKYTRKNREKTWLRMMLEKIIQPSADCQEFGLTKEEKTFKWYLCERVWSRPGQGFKKTFKYMVVKRKRRDLKEFFVLRQMHITVWWLFFPRYKSAFLRGKGSMKMSGFFLQ